MLRIERLHKSNPLQRPCTDSSYIFMPLSRGSLQHQTCAVLFSVLTSTWKHLFLPSYLFLSCLLPSFSHALLCHCTHPPLRLCFSSSVLSHHLLIAPVPVWCVCITSYCKYRQSTSRNYTWCPCRGNYQQIILQFFVYSADLCWPNPPDVEWEQSTPRTDGQSITGPHYRICYNYFGCLLIMLSSFISRYRKPG